MQFASFFWAGFECSSHRRQDGRRLDLLEATAHDRLAAPDYARMRAHGLCTARDGLRWHRIEAAPGLYDWSSWAGMLEAGRAAGMQTIWDLCHYGWPDHYDLWSEGFVSGFAAFAAAAAGTHRALVGEAPCFCLINEISYLAWAAGEVGRFAPYGERQGFALKRQLVRAALAAVEAVRACEPEARFLWAEPLIRVHAGEGRPQRLRADAAAFHEAQFQAADMLLGRLAPELGGREDVIDLLGANYYPHNQWLHGAAGATPMGHHGYQDASELLLELWRRYRKPMALTETGAEGGGRAAWLHYICAEVRAAQAAGADIRGLCLYPILCYPGWEDGRLCRTGLFGPADAAGARELNAPLAAELARQQALFASHETA